MKQYTATANDEGVRLSRFVQSVTRDLPTSLLYKSFRNKRTASRPETSLSCTSTMSFSRRREPSPPQRSRPKSSRTSPK